ncbi:MAG: SMP-30/gluconolactonase/LRE family protein [Bryobacteraceae bacterium]
MSKNHNVATMEISIHKFETYVDGLDHAEDLAFDAEGILWAGGELGQVYRIPSKGRVEEVTCIGGFCLGLAFSPSDVLFICNAKLASLVRVEKSGASTLFADWAGNHKLKLPNYGVFDSAGNLYVSDSGDWSTSNGCILRFDTGGHGTVFVKGPLPFPNGLALSSDERVLFIAQSHTDDVLQVEIRDDGTPGNREIYVRGVERVPDGLAFDLEGNLYVSCYASDNIYRVSSDRKPTLLAYDPTGTVLARPTNIAFGGTARNELYVANLGRWHINRTAIAIKGQPLANQKKAMNSGIIS